MIEIKVPTTLQIGGFNYSIEMSEEINKELWDNENWGEHSGRLRRIRLGTDCLPQQFSETFFHEVLHAIDTVYQGCQLSHQEISALSNGLLQIFEQLGVRIVK